MTARPADVPALLAALARRVATVSSLRLVAGDGGCVVVGPESDLPWFAGAVYLGWEAGALVPTTQRPLPAVDLVLASVPDWPRGARPAGGDDLVVVVPWAVLTAPSPGRPVDADALEALRRSRTQQVDPA